MTVALIAALVLITVAVVKGRAAGRMPSGTWIESTAKEAAHQRSAVYASCAVAVALSGTVVMVIARVLA